MARQENSMEFGKAFSFAFEDPDWLKKIAIAALVGLIPVVGQFVLIGWALETARRVIRQDPTPLADLDFGSQLGLGFKSFLVGLVYAIPALLIYLPMFAIPFVLGDSSNDTTGIVITLVMVCCGGLMALYALVMVVVIPAAQANLLATGRVGAAFNFRQVFGLLRAAPGAYLIVLLGGIIGGFIASLGMVACGIGVLFTSAYAMLISAHLMGQAYRAALANGANV
jgi:hypothetical protein